ncbi:hypothetical protein [Alkalisalibacterium limincola]|uniref:hypothetical protein n=1 Tax=Alkalisalibacterium limincola TaxID=2699169 RepID=UPI0031B80C8F
MVAAEAAVSNPLLDDINLAGANGILVNITAGPDFTMREFDEVGRTVEEYASEDATVVIGTVLDPDMADEVRVTVVATGLAQQAVRAPVRGNGEREIQRTPVKLVRNATTGAVDYEASGMSVPNTAQSLRGQGSSHASGRGESAPAPSESGGSDHSYLDIPAFLRRQAD